MRFNSRFNSAYTKKPISFLLNFFYKKSGKYFSIFNWFFLFKKFEGKKKSKQFDN